MSEQTVGAILSILAGVGFVWAFVLLGLWLWRRSDTRAERSARAALSERLNTKQAYCRDCGQRFTMHEHQDGYDTKTGAPLYKQTFYCPDWGNAASLKASSYLSYSSYPNCGVATRVPKKPAHLSHGKSVTVAQCPGCVDQMLTDGVINEQQAADLLDQ